MLRRDLEVYKELANAITPETLTRWIRSQAGMKYDSSLKRGPRHPTKPKEMRDLAIQLAADNPTWCYTKIQGVLKSLGHKVGRTTIRELLVSSGIAPAPERKKGKEMEGFHSRELECSIGDRFLHRGIIYIDRIPAMQAGMVNCRPTFRAIFLWVLMYFKGRWFGCTTVIRLALRLRFA